MKELQRICKYAPATTAMPLLNVGKKERKKFKNLQQHNITKNVLGGVRAAGSHPSSRARFAPLRAAVPWNRTVRPFLPPPPFRWGFRQTGASLGQIVMNIWSMGHCGEMKASQKTGDRRRNLSSVCGHFSPNPPVRLSACINKFEVTFSSRCSYNKFYHQE